MKMMSLISIGLTFTLVCQLKVALQGQYKDSRVWQKTTWQLFHHGLNACLLTRHQNYIPVGELIVG